MQNIAKKTGSLLVWVWLSAGLSACVTTARQTEALLVQPPTESRPLAYQIEKVPFVQQSTAYCGPATLTMAMQWAGKKQVTLDQVAPMVYTPGMKGSLQIDMISASRREGLMAVPIYGMAALLTEIKAGHPVIVFENLALSWLPQWHYAVVFGYDLAKPEVIMHSGPEAFKHWDMRKFERSWMLGDYWGLVVLPPNQLAASANELANLTAANGLEQAEKNSEAGQAYQQILKKWPRSLAASIGAANISFAQKDFLRAVDFLRQASQDHPDSAVVWHNLAIAQGAANQKKQAHQSALKAMQLVAQESRQQFAQNLQPWL